MRVFKEEENVEKWGKFDVDKRFVVVVDCICVWKCWGRMDGGLLGGVFVSEN